MSSQRRAADPRTTLLHSSNVEAPEDRPLPTAVAVFSGVDPGRSSLRTETSDLRRAYDAVVAKLRLRDGLTHRGHDGRFE
jgi:hypothetical protein